MKTRSLAILTLAAAAALILSAAGVAPPRGQGIVLPDGPAAAQDVSQESLTLSSTDVTPGRCTVDEKSAPCDGLALLQTPPFTQHEGHAQCVADAVEAFYAAASSADEAAAPCGIACDCGGTLHEFGLTYSSWAYKGLTACPHRMANHAAKLYERCVLHDWQCSRCEYGYTAITTQTKVECQALDIGLDF